VKQNHGFEFVAYLRVFFFSLYRSIAESLAWVRDMLSGLVDPKGGSAFINMEEAAAQS
jgi:hypothetical protein